MSLKIIDKYLELTSELNKMWNMVTVIQIVDDMFGTVIKWLEKRLKKLEIWGKIEIIQTTILLRSARIIRKVLRWSQRPPANTGVKNL